MLLHPASLSEERSGCNRDHAALRIRAEQGSASRMIEFEDPVSA